MKLILLVKVFQNHFELHSQTNEHSVTIESTNGTVGGTNVHGLGGLETQTHTDKLSDGWPQAQGAAVFKKNTPDKVANHAEIKQLREKVYPQKKD